MHNLCIHIYVYVPGIHSLELQKKATLIAVPKLRSTPLPPPPVAGCLAWPALLPPSLSHPSRPASVWIKLLGFPPLCSLASEQGMQDSGGRNLLLSVRWLCSPCTCQKGCLQGAPWRWQLSTAAVRSQASPSCTPSCSCLGQRPTDRAAHTQLWGYSRLSPRPLGPRGRRKLIYWLKDICGAPKLLCPPGPASPCVSWATPAALKLLTDPTEPRNHKPGSQ